MSAETKKYDEILAMPAIKALPLSYQTVALVFGPDEALRRYAADIAGKEKAVVEGHKADLVYENGKFVFKGLGFNQGQPDDKKKQEPASMAAHVFGPAPGQKQQKQTGFQDALANRLKGVRRL